MADGGEMKAGECSCRICLESMCDAAPQCTLPCGHAFHTACIMTALRTSANCPLCRAPFFAYGEDDDADDASSSDDEERHAASLLAAFSALRAEQRRFNARTSRHIRRSPRLAALRNRVRVSMKECVAMEKRVWARWKVVEAAAWNCVEMRGLRVELGKSRRKYRRLSQRLEKVVEQRFGPPPSAQVTITVT